ncbi:MAG: hypothetical protein AABN95_10215 [Acidobacteriota bacterium]
MKRCPNCEFIYEDHQSLCDMDGQTLVHDHAFSVQKPRISAERHIASTSSLKGITLPACAGLLLAAVVFVGHYASSNSLNAKTDSGSAQSAAQGFDLNSPVQNNPSSFLEPTGAAAALESAAPQPPESETTANASPATQPGQDSDKAAYAHFEARNERFPIARSVPPLPRLRPLPRLPNAKPLERKPNSAGIVRPATNSTQQKAKSATPTKKDSKLGSFLKKTGRVLTKPFRL